MIDMSSRPGTHDVPIASLRMDGGTQSRAKLDEDTIAEYAQAYRDGVQLPPVIDYRDTDGTRWLADGFHRVLAAQRAGKVSIGSCTFKGSKRDAVLYSCSANVEHGLRRTNADKRRAVEMLLRDAEWGKWPLRKVAEVCGVSHEFVRSLSTVDKKPTSTVDKKPTSTVTSLTTSTDKDSRSGPQTPGPTVPGNQREGKKGGGVLATGDRTLPVTPLPGEPDNSTPTEGDEGEGVPGHLLGAHRTPSPDEPCIDMLGLTAPAAWLESVRLVADMVESIDQQLRQMQGQARYLPQPHQQRMYAALHDAAALARALLPSVVCPMRAVGDHKDCMSCAGLGWLTAEGRKGLHPSMLVKGAA